MDETEFDKFATEYQELHEAVLGPSGEDTEFFAKYKVRDTADLVANRGYPDDLAIMDFGSGVGLSVPWFLQVFPACRLTCLDVSRKSLEIGRSRFEGRPRFVHFDGSTIPFDADTFHLVFTACVFHHIPPDHHRRLVEEIHRVLKPEGLFIAFEHNPWNPLTVRAVNACEFDANAQLIRGPDFRRLLRECGLVRERLRYRLFFPGALRGLRPLESFLAWLPLGAQYHVSAQKPL